MEYEESFIFFGCPFNYLALRTPCEHAAIVVGMGGSGIGGDGSPDGRWWVRTRARVRPMATWFCF